MPAIDSLPPPDIQAVPRQAPVPPPDQQAPAGNSAAGGTQFGDVLASSIKSAPQSAPQGGTHSAPPVPQSANPAAQTAPAPVTDTDVPKSDVNDAPQQATPAASDPQALLAAALAGAVIVQVDQAAPVEPVAQSPASGGQPASAPAPIPGSAPAQLINNLLVSQVTTPPANSGSETAAPAETDTTPAAPAQAGTGAAPQGLVAGLEQIRLPTPAAAPDVRGQASVVKQLPAGPSPDSASAEAAQPAASQIVPAVPTAQISASFTDVTATATISQVVSPQLPPTRPVVTSSKAIVTPTVTVTDAGDSTNSTPPETASVAITPAPPETTVQSAISSTPAAGPNNSPPQSPEPAGAASSGVSRPPAEFITLSATTAAPATTATAPASASDPAPVSAVATPAPGIPPRETGSPTDLVAGNQEQGSTDSIQVADQSRNPNPGALPFGAAPPSLQLTPTSHAIGQGTATAPVNPAQVVEQVTYALQLTHSSGQQMQLHLTPPQLGALQVDVSVRDGVLSARLEAQAPATQQILVDNLSQLKDSLIQQGVNFDRIEVRLAGSGAGFGESNSTDRSFAQQQEGGLPWDPQPPASDGGDPASAVPAPNWLASRKPLTSLDIMI